MTWAWLAALPVVIWAVSWVRRGDLSLYDALLGGGFLAVMAVVIAQTLFG